MKVTKEMFWNLPQLSRIEYMLVRKELRDRSQVGAIFEIFKLVIWIVGYMVLLLMVSLAIGNNDLTVSLTIAFSNVLKALCIALVLGVVIDIIMLYIESKKHKEINRRFFNEDKKSSKSVQDLQQVNRKE